MRRSRILGTPGPGRVWTATYACDGCGEQFLHIEASTADDDPLSLPLAMRVCCFCDGILYRLGDE